MESFRLRPLLVGVILASLLVRPCFGGGPGGERSLAEMNRAVGLENYAEAKRAADTLLRSKNVEERVSASLRYGRILLGLGRQDEVQRYLLMMQRVQLDEDARQLMQVYAAWLQSLQGDVESAIRTLENLVKKKANYTSTAEAADVLGRLYLQRGEKQKAEKVVAEGLRLLRYLNIKTGYLETLLRSRMTEEAEKLFAQAQQLAGQEKWTEAGKLFTQIRNEYPKSTWSPAAGYQIGRCLVGLKRYRQALDYWKGFIDEQPAGPWRGQAQVALVDLALEKQLDLATAAKHAAAASAVLKQAAASGVMEPSWQEAAYDLSLRMGILSLIERRYDDAAEALRQAKQAATNRSAALAVGLDRLILAAEKRLGLLPGELGSGTSDASLAVAVGNLYTLARQFDRAKALFDLPLLGQTKAKSRSHRSFAALGKARAEQGLREYEAAKRNYQLSLQEYVTAEWHQETLRELGLLIEQQAEAQLAAQESAKVQKNNKKGQEESKPLTRQQRAAVVAKARAEALPFWARLVERHPASPHLPEALYHAGILYGEGGQWPQAVEAFERLAREYPDGPFTGDTQVRLVDVKLEHEFDLLAAQEHATAALEWLEGIDPKRLAASNTTSVSGARAIREVAYDIYVRAGLLEYLDERPEAATGLFEKARQFDRRRDLVVVAGEIPTGIERLIQVVKGGKTLTPQVVLDGDPTAKLILMLADIYHEVGQYEQSWDLCTRILNDTAHATKEQKAWALFRRGRNAYSFDGAAQDVDAALVDYLAAVKLTPQAPWADKALFLAANIEWNHRHDADRAVARWRDLIRLYPNSPEAGRSAYYIGIAYQWSDRPEEAVQTLTEFVEGRPDSRFVGGAKKLLAKLQKTNAPVSNRGNATSKTIEQNLAPQFTR